MVLLLLLVMMLGVQTGQAAQPAKGVFETCPACRLNAMPELKRFLMQSIMTKEYGENLSVKYIFGKTPTLILYDAEGKVMSETEVDARLNFAALHQWVQGMGFVKQAASEGEGNSTTSGTAAADTATQQTPTAAAAAGSMAGTALLPATPQTATDGPAVVTTAAAGAATPAAPAPAEAAPVPAEPPALKPTQAGQKPQQQQQPEQQQQRRRHRRRRMRQRGQQGQQQQHRRRRQEGPGNLYL